METDFHVYKLSRKKLYIWIAIGITLLVAIIVARWFTADIEIKGNGTGLLAQFEQTRLCQNDVSRPLAVMLSSDNEARPLSGISQADIVFEMPVTESGVTRMMAVYRCIQPKEIGSIRSARLDFIPLVQGLDAIYSHWGGEKQALDQLNDGVTDNVNGLLYDGTVYYRKDGIEAPHNGFSSFSRLWNQAQKLGYDIEGDRTRNYLFENSKSEGIIEPPEVYVDGFNVSWSYNPQTNQYERYRNNLRERDANTGEPTFVENVVHMHTTWSPINIDYIRVTTIGSGPAEIYRNGRKIDAVWNKPTANAPLKFYEETNAFGEDDSELESDELGPEITFTKGKI